jgi:hypothetical protein
MISERYIRQLETKLGCTASGTTRDEMVSELESARAERAMGLARITELGLRANRYPGRCCVTGERVQGGDGYCREENGRWVTYSRKAVKERFGI